MSEVVANNKEINPNVLWYFIWWLFSFTIIRKVLGIWLPRYTAFSIAFSIAILGIANLIFFLQKRTWFHKKLGDGVKGFITINAVAGLFTAIVIVIFKYLIPLIPPVVMIGIFVLFFFALVIGLFFWITKSTK